MSAASKVLLIEDNSRIASQLHALLEGMGLEVVVASTGIEGLLAYNRELPHLLILEQFLPLLSGEEVVRRLRATMTSAEIPVVMLVSSRFGSLSSTLRGQLDVVLEKPLQATRFQQGVLHALQKGSGQPRPLAGANSPEQFYLDWGELSETPLPALLFQLAEQRFTGLLTLALPQGERRLAFRDGGLYYAESLAQDEQFLSFLQRRAADSGQLSKLNAVVVGTGGRAVLQREALLRSGQLPALEMGPLYQLYLENVVIRSLFLTQGPYRLLDDLAYVERVCTGEPLPLLPLLLEGVQHYYTAPKLIQALAAYREYVCMLSPQYERYVGPLVQKLPSISFSPNRISMRRLARVFDDFSPDMALNAQIVQTLLLAQLLSFQPADTAGRDRTPAGSSTIHRGARQAAPSSGSHRTTSHEVQDGSFPGGAYQSSLPPLPGMVGSQQGHGEAMPVLQGRPVQTGSQPGAMHRTGQYPPRQAPAMRTGQHPSHAPAMRTGQHPPHPAMQTGQHPPQQAAMRTGQHGPPVATGRGAYPTKSMRSGDYGEPLHRTGQYPPQQAAAMRTGQHPSQQAAAMRTGQHPSQAPAMRTGQRPPHPAMQTGQRLAHPSMQTGQRPPQAAMRTGQHPSQAPVMRSGQHGPPHPAMRTGQHAPHPYATPLPARRPGSPGNPQALPTQRPASRPPAPPRSRKPKTPVDALPRVEEPDQKGNFPSADPDFRRQLNEDYLRSQSEDYFTILDVSSEASDDEIRAAYKELFRLYNADRFKRDPNKDVATKASEIYRKVSQACAVLSTPHARKSYEERREKKQPQIKNKLLFAQEEFRQGEYMIKNNRFRDAIPHLRKAIDANEKDPAYYMMLGWALFRASPTNPKQSLLARTYIEKALTMNPIFEDAYLYLGTIRKEQGALREAAELFQRILILNPGHADAHRLLAELSESG